MGKYQITVKGFGVMKREKKSVNNSLNLYFMLYLNAKNMD